MGKASRKRRERMEQVQQAREIEGLVKRARLYDTFFWEQKARYEDEIEEIQTYAFNEDVNAHEFSGDDASIYPTLMLDNPIVFNVQAVYDRIVESFKGNDEWTDPPAFNQDYMDWIGGESFAEDTTGRIYDYRLLTPPFSSMWIEYTSLPSWVHHSYFKMSSDDKTFRVGVYFVCIDKDDFGFPTVFAEVYRDGDLSPQVAQIGRFKFRLCSTKDEWLSNPSHFWLDTVGSGSEYTLTQAALVAIDAIQFLNVRNIVTVDHEPDPADNAAYQRHFGVPMTKYKTLAIKSMGKRHKRDSEPSPYQDVMPLHIRRGHFKTFTEDNPRFGYNHPSNIGTFWNQATAVGNATNGIRVKDYEVKGDSAAYAEMAKTADQRLSEMQQRNGEAFTALETAIKESQL